MRSRNFFGLVSSIILFPSLGKQKPVRYFKQLGTFADQFSQVQNKVWQGTLNVLFTIA